MAETAYGLNSNETVKLWSRKLFRESLKATRLSQFMGDSTESIIQMVDDFSKGPGDRIRQILRVQLSGVGIGGDGVLKGNEEALTTYTDDLVIDQLRHAVKSSGKMSEQRIPFSVREEARMGLTDWWADRIDTVLFNQLAGNTAESSTLKSGSNATTAPTTNRTHWPNSKTSDATLSAADTMTIDLIDDLVEKAKVSTPLVRPARVGGEPYYVLFLHPYQVTDLRQNTNTGQWLDIQKAAMQGGRVDNNPIFTGALGIHNGVVIHESSRVPQGVNSGAAVSNTRRAVFLGAQAALIGFGRDNGPNAMTWVEELDDYKNKLGVAAGMIWGVKKTVFNSEDFGVFALATYAAAH